MKRYDPGSVLISTLFLLGFVTAVIISGTAYLMQFSREARSLENRLTARHLAWSGIAFAESTGQRNAEWVNVQGGRFRLGGIAGEGGEIFVTSYGECLRGPRTVARFQVTCAFRAYGKRLKRIRAVPDSIVYPEPVETQNPDSEVTQTPEPEGDRGSGKGGDASDEPLAEI